MEILRCGHLSFALAAPERLSVKDALQCALEKCATPMVEETILQSIPYSGFPAAVEAFGWLRDHHPTVADRPPTSPTEDHVPFFQRIYGPAASRIEAELQRRHPQLQRWIEEFAYGTVMDSSSMEAGDVELLAVASLIGQGRMTPLHSHLRGALRCGVSADTLSQLIEELAGWARPQVITTSRDFLQQERQRPL